MDPRVRKDDAGMEDPSTSRCSAQDDNSLGIDEGADCENGRSFDKLRMTFGKYKDIFIEIAPSFKIVYTLYSHVFVTSTRFVTNEFFSRPR